MTTTRDYFKEQTYKLLDKNFVKCGLCGAIITKSKTTISSHLSRNHKKQYIKMNNSIFKGFEAGKW